MRKNILLFTLSLSILASISFFVYKTFFKLNIEKQVLNGQDIDKYLDKKYGFYYNLVKLLAQDSILKNGSSSQKMTFLNNVVNSFDEINYAFIIDSIGNLRSFSELKSNSTNLDASYFLEIQRDSWFKKLINEKFTNYFDKGLVGGYISKYTIDTLTKNSGHYFAAPYYDEESRIRGYLVYFLNIEKIDEELTSLGVNLRKSFVVLENETSVKNSITDGLEIFYTYKASQPSDVLKNPIFYSSIVTVFSLFAFVMILFTGLNSSEKNSELDLINQLKIAKEKNYLLEGKIKNLSLIKINHKELKDYGLSNLQNKKIQILINKNKSISNEIETSISSISAREEEIRKNTKEVIEIKELAINDINKIKARLRFLNDYFVKLNSLKKNMNIEIMNIELKLQRNELDSSVANFIDILKFKLDELNTIGTNASNDLEDLLNASINNELLNNSLIKSKVISLESSIQSTLNQELKVKEKLHALLGNLLKIEEMTLKLHEHSVSENSNYTLNKVVEFKKVA